MVTRYLLPTVTAAMALGLTAETLRSWRRRGLGPAYVRYPGAYRSRSSHEYWEEKAHGSVFYPEEELKAFIAERRVEGGRLPRPFPGRLPGGINRGGKTSSADCAPCRKGEILSEGDLRLCSTASAALLLGVLPETLRSWRRRGIGPPYVRLPGGHTRRGIRFWETKQYGHVRYPLDGLLAFVERLKAQQTRLPRPFPGRLPYRRSKPIP